jgi:hypothetical protein
MSARPSSPREFFEHYVLQQQLNQVNQLMSRYMSVLLSRHDESASPLNMTYESLAQYCMNNRVKQVLNMEQLHYGLLGIMFWEKQDTD